jgi:hypothetical protein
MWSPHEKYDRVVFFSDWKPAWFTFDEKNAKWYALDSVEGALMPVVITADVSYKKAAAPEDLERIASSLDVEVGYSDETRQSPDNPNDVLYDRRVLEALENEGFDAFIGDDELVGSWIKVLVVWHVLQINIESFKGPEHLTTTMMQTTLG